MSGLTSLKKAVYEHFGKFEKRKLGGIEIEMMPPRCIAPTVKQEFYDQKNRGLVLLFDTNQPPREKRFSENVSLLVDPDVHTLSGIKVVNFDSTRISAIRNQLFRALDDYVDDALKQLKTAPKEGQFREFARFDSEMRKVEVFKEYFEPQHLWKVVQSLSMAPDSTIDDVEEYRSAEAGL